MRRPEEIDNDELATILCGPEDREEQARLFNACFKKKLDAEALRWRYDENPHGRALSLLSRPPGGDGICGYACSPRLALCRGEEATLAPIGETGDVMTHPDWRKRGIFRGLDAACMREAGRQGWPLVFGLPNRRSAHIFVQMGWVRVGTIRPHTFVLRSDRAARAARRVDGRLRSLAVPLDARRGRRARRRLRDAAAAGGFQVRPLEAFPAEVEALSRAREKDFALMVRRDAAYLDWRFLRNTSGLHRALGLFDGHGRLAAYVVVQLPREGGRTGFLVDVLARDAAAQAGAMEAGLARLEEAGASAVQATAVDGGWWQRQLAAAGFRPPRPENCLSVILYVHDPAHPLARAGRDASSWYLTDGDRDDETMG